MAVVLDSTAAPCDQIPESSTLADATLLVILGEGPPSSSLLARVFRQSGRAVPRAVRATALLARGFVGIGAGVDPASGMDLVWGYAAQASAD